MGIFDKLRNRHQTDFIALNPHNCVACWDCYDTCPKHILGKIDFLGHRHVKIRNAADCIGCMKCVRICRHGAITPKK